MFVISGLQNPQRAQIRQKALEMGAQYRTNWQADCTHLFCPFQNTPKLRDMVRTGRGIALRPDFVTDCYLARRRVEQDSYLLIPSSFYSYSDRADENENEEEESSSSYSISFFLYSNYV